MGNQFNSQSRTVEDRAVPLLATRMQGLDEDDLSALKEVPVLHRFVGRKKPVISDGQHISCLKVLCKGWAIRMVALDKERRQILDVVLPGDVIGLHVDGEQVSTCDVIALTPCEVSEFDLRAVQRMAGQYPKIGAGLRRHLMREMAQANDQLLRLGRMTAYERVCSFLLDLYSRQRARFPDSRVVDFQITQTIAADALGLSVVHVNRQVMRLRREGLVSLNRKQLVVHDTDRLAEVSGFQNRRFDPEPQSILDAAG